MINKDLGEIMDDQIELLRDKLQKLIVVKEGHIDNEVIALSQELDKLIYQYYSSKLISVV